MNNIDYYNSLGFRAGLECHQQLDGHKLFCKCPCIIRDDNYDFEVKRYLRLSESEVGSFDPAAQFEIKKNKQFVYKGYNNINCLVELDESPPEDLNKKALEIALQVTLLLNAKPVDVVQFMRKMVIDGSNVSGFQRTAIIGLNGYIDTSEGRVSITTVCLEEESAKKLEDTDSYRIYNISRLCIPLIEIATGPDINSPLQAKECAEKIGMILRSVKGVKRGLGTIRQDVNISIKGHPRIEIKGFQDLRSIPKIVDFEIKRQLELIKNGSKLISEVRKAEPDFTTSFLRPMPGSSRMYPETDAKPVYITKELLSKIEIPELIADKVESLEESYNITSEQARELLKLNKIDLFVKCTSLKNVNTSFIAETIIAITKELKRKFNLNYNIKDDFFFKVFYHLDKNDISKEAIINIFADNAKELEFNLNNYKKASLEYIEIEIKKIISDNPGKPFGALMGEAMKILKGKGDGKLVSELIKKNLK